MFAEVQVIKMENRLTEFYYPESLEQMLKGDILIMGMGKSGQAAYRSLKSCGASPIGYDKNSELIKSLFKTDPTFRGIDSLVELGEIFKGTIVVSPGVDWEQFRSIFSGGSLGLISEVGLGAMLNSSARIVSITGTNGKSTVTALISHLLNCVRENATPCGNFGLPFTQWLMDEGDSKGIGVIELSSYQLEHLRNLAAKVAVLLPVESDHLIRHHSIERYLDIKFNIVRHDNLKGVLIADHSHEPKLRQMNLNVPTAFVNEAGIEGAVNILKTEKGVSGDVNLTIDWAKSLPGKHNIKNILSALGAYFVLTKNAPPKGSIEGFKSLPFRQEFVLKDGNRWIINDSKATSPDAVVAAINSVTEPFNLIMGGRNKGLDFSSVAKAVTGKNVHVWIYGESAIYLQSQIKTSQRCDNLKQVLEDILMTQKKEGWKNILFSPGCESFDQFENYIDRGNQFNKLIDEMGFSQK